MKDFIYKARNELGKLTSGIIEAEESDIAIGILKEKGYLLMSIKESKRFSFSFLSSMKGFKKKISLSEINVFSRQLSILLRAGIPFLSAFSTIREQTQSREFKQILAGLIKDIEKGAFFSEALSSYEDTFGKVYIGMVKTAEAGGILDQILERLAVLGERESEIKSEIKSASAYPILVISTLVGAFFVVITVVVPKFANVFSQFEGQLPLPTRVLIGLNYFISHFWHIGIIGFAALIAGIKFFINTPGGRLFWDTMKLKIPIVGPLILRITLSRFARTMSVLARVGVPIVKVLELAKESVANTMLSRTIADISNKVIQGEGLSLAMKESKAFPPIVTQMVAAGEGAGKLDELLMFVSDYYDTEVKYALKNLIIYIEPILVFVLGLGVLFMALAIFLPMWNLIQLFKH